jgi:DNA-binding CsgD family transcriptional regulator
MNGYAQSMLDAPPNWRQWLDLTLDALDVGILLLSNSRVLHANPPARALMALAGAPLSIEDGALVVHDALQHHALQAALRGASHRLLTLRHGAHVVQLAVVPLRDAGRLVVLGRQGLGRTAAAQWLCKSQELTPAEASVLADLLDGHAPNGIAARHGVAVSTVRTQMARIADKCDTRGVARLLIAAASLPPVAAVSNESRVRLQLQA